MLRVKLMTPNVQVLRAFQFDRGKKRGKKRLVTSMSATQGLVSEKA